MQITRRTLVAGLTATALASCGGGGGGAPSAPVARAAFRAVPNPGFDAWVAAFRPRAAAAGVSAPTLDRALSGAGFLPDVIEKDRNQTEFTRTLEDYLAIAASDERIAKGRAELARRAGTFAAIEARYGVPPDIVAAVWGLESRYGERRGDVPVISALATLAFDGRRGSFFEKQLIAALQILDRGDTSAAAMTGSWAGAMGHTQFIPTSFQAIAVDFTGDGRRDIWSDDPTDALASTAAYLSRNGWRQGHPWGMEVSLPAGFSGGLLGRGNARDVAAWTSAGVKTARGGALPDYGPASILAPQGLGAPAFAVYRNFRVILSYNNSDLYGLGVGHLADRLAGQPPLRGRFPPDDTGLTLDDRKELQRRLTAKGFDTQGADGVVGPDTIAAITAYQQRNGLPATGQPSPDLLRRLR